MDLADALILIGVVIGSVAGPVLLAWKRRKTWRTVRWLPIDDAPTDRPVLLSDGQYVVEGVWGYAGSTGQPDCTGFDGWINKGLNPFESCWGSPDAILKPTHWAEMPGPPRV